MTFHHQIMGAILKPIIHSLSRRRLPQVSGKLRLRGLSAPVFIHRDKWGLPFIEATNRHDLYFAQGFVHAQDRLWQMELYRRAATGRLAEIIGPRGLETDRMTRTLGFNHLATTAWNNTSETVRHDVKAYSAGINAYINTCPKLPVEFTLLRYQPNLWQPEDSVALGRLIAWTLSHVWAGKLARAKCIEAVGSELADQLDAHYPRGNPVTLPLGIEFNTLQPDGMFHSSNHPFFGQALDNGTKGSNGWVISRDRSASGSPLLCNDMHLPISTPSIWYFLHMKCQDRSNSGNKIHVTGVSLPGLPYVLVGHNEHIAWGATVSFIDTEDLFVEKLDPDKQNTYCFEDAWRPIEFREERIKVKGKSDHIETIRLTRHGPIISSIEAKNNHVLALQSIALQPVESFTGFAMLNEARNWFDFAGAIQLIETPALNFLYADIEGNIGYYLSGRMPIRAQVKADVPVPGWSGEHEWIGHIPFEEMPHALNPQQGYIVSANHRIVDDDYPHYLGRSWRNGYRAKRIEQLINEKDQLTVDNCRRLQLDIFTVPGQLIAKMLATVKSQDPDTVLCVQILSDWDGYLSVDSTGGAVYRVLTERLARSILGSRLDQVFVEYLLGSGPDPILYPANELHGQWPAILIRLLDDPECQWLPEAKHRNGYLGRVMAESIVELRQLMGDDPDSWSWGRLHQIRFDHAFSVQPPLDQIFNLGPFPIGGDPDTVAQTSTISNDPGDNIAASFRQIIDLGKLSEAIAIHVPGQSGQVGNPHYADLTDAWFAGEYYSMAWQTNPSKTEETVSLELLPSP